MRYTLFPCGKGYLSEQIPKAAGSGDIVVGFDGIDSTANKCVAMFTTNVAEGNAALATLYRDIDEKGECIMPISKLEGQVTVTVSVDGKRYTCGSIFIRHNETYGCFLQPVNIDLNKEIIASRAAEKALEEAKKDLVCRVEVLEEKLERLIEGYDLE
jgi:hypothetical protein